MTLNRSDEIDAERVVARSTFAHPLYTVESLRAQRELPRLSGERRTYTPGRTTETASTRTASPPASGRPPRSG